MASTTALLIIDVQRDFGEATGALSVPEGEAVIPFINELRGELQGARVFLTQDWHPADHASFAANNAGAALFSTVELPGVGPQVMWPVHCVQDSPGADFCPALVRAPGDVVVRKGSARDVDSYSGFGSPGRTRERTALEDALRAAGVQRVVLAGLALDYCVAFTARDAAEMGFATCVARYATRGIADESVAKEMGLMARAGVVVADDLEGVRKFVAAPTPPPQLPAS